MKKYKYERHLSKFHGGGIIQTHYSLKSAYNAVKKAQRKTDCLCGCQYIIDTDAEWIGSDELMYIVETNQIDIYENMNRKT